MAKPGGPVKIERGPTSERLRKRANEAKPHYTSKSWHVIPMRDGRFNIRCDTSYATAGVMEMIFDPRDYSA